MLRNQRELIGSQLSYRLQFKGLKQDLFKAKTARTKGLLMLKTDWLKYRLDGNQRGLQVDDLVQGMARYSKLFWSKVNTKINRLSRQIYGLIKTRTEDKNRDY